MWQNFAAGTVMTVEVFRLLLILFHLVDGLALQFEGVLMLLQDSLITVTGSQGE
jgi:hypothetical protein